MAGRLSETEQARIDVDSYYARGTSRTKPNSTLFISFRDVKPPVPTERRASYAEALFASITGYQGVRQVRGMCFVDFDSVKASTAAMMQFQGRAGLTVDYDKDRGVATKRQRESSERTQMAQHAAASCSYYCASCGTKALRTNGKLLSTLPARGTDGARVVENEATSLEQLLLELLAGAQPARVQRAKGVEKQFRLGCRSCAEFIAYRSTPAATSGGYLYILPEKLRESPPALEHNRSDHHGQTGPEDEVPSQRQRLSGAEVADDHDASGAPAQLDASHGDDESAVADEE